MRIGQCLVAVVLATGLAALAVADEPRKPGATGIFVPGAGRDLTIAVLTEKQFQEALKLTTGQREKLKPLAESHDAAQKAWRADRSDPAKAKDATAAFEKAQAETKKAVEAILTAEQNKRLTQIERQAAGVHAFLEKDTGAALDLSIDQYVKVAAVFEKLRADSRRHPDERFAADGARVEKLQKAALAELVGLLTDGQKKVWAELVGEPFDTSRIRFQPIATPFSVTLLKNAPNAGRLAPRPAAFSGPPIRSETVATVLQTRGVVEDLKLSDAEAAQVAAWVKERAAKYAKAKSEYQDLTGAERAAKVEAVRAKENEEGYAELGKLLKPEQVRRVKQIQLQFYEFEGLARPDVVAALRLTPAQRDAVAAAIQEHKEKSREAIHEEMRKGELTLSVLQAKTEEVDRATWAKLLGGLTEEQRKAWREMIGEPLGAKSDAPAPKKDR
jgi:hypothetical protein